MTMRGQLHRSTRILTALVLLIGLLPAGGPPARADSAPMWQSPIGLTPGLPDNRVQMIAETVDIRVVERDGSARAHVTATFDLLNHGPEVSMKVGFPTYAMSILMHSPEDHYSPVASMPDLDGFVARADETTYRVKQEEVITRPGDRYGDAWYVWEMTFPSERMVRLLVSYEQALTWQGDDDTAWAQPMYVLRTGALWDGPIGEATITMSTSSGGVFFGGPEVFLTPERTLPEPGDVLGPSQAMEASPTRLVWKLHDVEPTQDVGAVYIFGAIWDALRAGEEAMVTSSNSASDYLKATRAALRVMSTSGPDLIPMGPAFAPKATVDRFAPQVRRWAARGVALAPDDATAWLVFGDVEVWFARPGGHHADELACWPTNAVDAYRRAIGLGSQAAVNRLEALDEIRSWMHDLGEPEPLPCPVRETWAATRLEEPPGLNHPAMPERANVSELSR